jgi:hypothetical protein
MPIVLVVQAIRKRTLKLAEPFVKMASERNQIKGLDSHLQENAWTNVVEAL